MCSYYDKEWGLVENIFNDMAGGDSPWWALNRAFEEVAAGYDADPTIPPSVILEDAYNRLDNYRERAKSEESAMMFESIADEIKNALVIYLEGILFYDPKDIEDFAVERVAIPTYFTKTEYEEMRKEFRECEINCYGI